MNKLIIVLMLLLASCANQQVTETKSWAAANIKLAQSGQIKWSDYYLQFYDRIKNINGIEDKGFYLELTNQNIDAAKAYEEGKISKEEFDSYQRKAEAIAIKHDDEFRQAQYANSAIIYSQYLQTQAILNRQWQQRQPIYCNSSAIGNSVQTNCN